MFTKFDGKELVSYIDNFFDKRGRGHLFKEKYRESMMTGAEALANRLSSSKVSFDTGLPCAFAAILEETRGRFHDRYQADYQFKQQQRPWYECTDKNITKARKNFKDVMASVSFEEIYKDIAEDKTKRYSQKHEIPYHGQDTNLILA